MGKLTVPSSIVRNFIAYLCIASPLILAQNPRQPGQLPGSGPYVPLSRTDKFKYRLFNTVELRGFAGAAMGAGVQQVFNSPREWGRGVDGYAKRYASAFGGAVIRQSLDLGFEGVLHEDPRYFPMDSGSTAARTWNALKQTFLTKTDSGKTTFAYGRFAAALATGQITRIWLPPSNSSVGYGFRSGGYSLGVDASVNLLYEFFPSSRPKELKP